MPRGKIHKFVYGSSFQSIDLAVITVPSKPLYTTRVQASVRDKAATDKISDNFIRSHISFFCNLGLLYRKVRTKKRQQLPYKRLYSDRIPGNLHKYA